MCLYEEKAKIELDTFSNVRNFPSLSLSFSLTSLSLSRQLSNYSLYLFLFVSLSPSLSLSLFLSLCFTSFPFFQSINPSFFFLTFTSSFLFSRYLLLCSHYSLSFSFLSFFLSFFLHSYFHPSHSLYFFLSLSLSVTHSLLHFFYLVISIFLLKKRANPGLVLLIFVLFKHKFYRKNCRLQQDSNSDRRSRRLAR